MPATELSALSAHYNQRVQNYMRGPISAAVRKSLPWAKQRQRTLRSDPVTQSIFGRYVAVLEELERFEANHGQ